MRKNDFFYVDPWRPGRFIGDGEYDNHSYFVFFGRYKVPFWLGFTSLGVLAGVGFIVSVIIDIVLGMGGWLTAAVMAWMIILPLALALIVMTVVGLARVVQAWRKVLRGGRGVRS